MSSLFPSAAFPTIGLTGLQNSSGNNRSIRLPTSNSFLSVFQSPYNQARRFGPPAARVITILKPPVSLPTSLPSPNNLEYPLLTLLGTATAAPLIKTPDESPSSQQTSSTSSSQQPQSPAVSATQPLQQPSSTSFSQFSAAAPQQSLPATSPTDSTLAQQPSPQNPVFPTPILPSSTPATELIRSTATQITSSPATTAAVAKVMEQPAKKTWCQKFFDFLSAIWNFFFRCCCPCGSRTEEQDRGNNNQ